MDLLSIIIAILLGPLYLIQKDASPSPRVYAQLAT